MSHFLIYVQGIKTLPDVGLDHLLDGHMSVPVSEGPDGNGGTIYAWPTATDNRMNYLPDEQTWVPSVKQGDLESGSYWFGYWKDRKPTPGELARSNQCQGVYIKMFDGNEWQIPYVERLPASLKKVNDGTVERKLHERYYDIFL
ncbi:MAG: hypothetical protein KDA77_18190, partial [Planctomycetaceae bacterium]|nr:hypothetical protein [Planctomycetaceae bacterium]